MFKVLRLTFILAAFVLLLASFAERLLFVNAAWYPEYLINENLGEAFTRDWFLLQREECGESLEIYEKDAGKSILRCRLAWPFTTTWVVDTAALKRAGIS